MFISIKSEGLMLGSTKMVKFAPDGVRESEIMKKKSVLLLYQIHGSSLVFDLNNKHHVRLWKIYSTLTTHT